MALTIIYKNKPKLHTQLVEVCGVGGIYDQLQKKAYKTLNLRWTHPDMEVRANPSGNLILFRCAHCCMTWTMYLSTVSAIVGPSVPVGMWHAKFCQRVEGEISVNVAPLYLIEIPRHVGPKTWKLTYGPDTPLLMGLVDGIMHPYSVSLSLGEL